MNIDYKEKHLPLIPFPALCSVSRRNRLEERLPVLCCHSSSQRGGGLGSTLGTNPGCAWKKGKGAGTSSARPQHGSSTIAPSTSAG